MEQRQLKIFSKTDAPRLRYIAGLILGDILGLQWEIITDRRRVGKCPVINYSDENIPDSFKISPDVLLFEAGFNSREISVERWSGMPVIFKTNTDSDLPFDIFAASFFLVSRYEEYLDYTPDTHGRFKASSSLAFRHNFLLTPVIDLWAKEFSRMLVKRFQSLAFKRNDFKAIVTLDTDEPFAYLGKGLFRSLGGLLTDIVEKKGHASDRYRIIARGEKDPFEVFDYIIEKIVSFNSEARFFFPVGDHSEFDQNPSWKNEEYRNLIRKLSAKFDSGLHPSYFASANASLVITEAERLNEILAKPVVIGRYHYIRLFMPDSYRNLIGAGVTEDYSMGYPDEPGFRAGIARPYYFYDIAEEKQTNLRIIPFQVMDATLYQYKKLSVDEARELLLKLITQTREVGGFFVSIWHNTSLLDNKHWQGWRDVFEFMLKTQTQ